MPTPIPAPVDYDTAGRPSQRSDVVNSTTFTQTFGYNTLDRLTTLTHPAQSGRQVGYAYDSEGRVTRVFNAATQADYASLFSYHASGAVTEYVGSNSLVHQFAYEAQTYRLSSIGVVGVVGAFGLGYTYDAVGNVSQITDARGASWTYSFGYDALDRLTSATGNGQYPSPCYAYDARGNRIHTEACQTTTYAYNAQERLTNQSGTTFTYDATGNMLTRSLPNQSYTYTAGNQLATATQGGSTTSYQYDADGWRLLTIPPSGPTQYVVRGPAGGVLLEWNGTLGRDHIYAGGRLIAWAESTGAVFDVTTDALGSIRMVTNASQTIVERHDFLPFGEEWAPPPASLSPVKFTGKEHDAETGFDYFGARYLHGTTGRFTSPDSWIFANPADPQSWNLYVYVRNNPLRFIDPDGHEPCKNDYYDDDGNPIPCFGSSTTGGISIPADLLTFPDHPDDKGGGGGGGGGGQTSRALLPQRCTPDLGCFAASPFMPPLPLGRAASLVGRLFGLGKVVANPSIAIRGFQGSVVPGHALNQIINRGVSPQLLRSIMANPTAVFEQAGGRYLYLSGQGAVVITGDGQVVTAYTVREFLPYVWETLKAVMGP